MRRVLAACLASIYVVLTAIALGLFSIFKVTTWGQEQTAAARNPDRT